MATGLESVEVRATHVGRGVFAGAPLEAEEVVSEVDGRIVDGAEHSSDYCIDLGHEVSLEPEEPFRFLNHSCEPNCELVLWRQRLLNTRRYNRLWLQTLRPIATGEELTIDYRWPASEAIRCACGSSNCRGWIVDPDQLDEITVA